MTLGSRFSADVTLHLSMIKCDFKRFSREFQARFDNDRSDITRRLEELKLERQYEVAKMFVVGLKKIGVRGLYDL